VNDEPPIALLVLSPPVQVAVIWVPDAIPAGAHARAIAIFKLASAVPAAFVTVHANPGPLSATVETESEKYDITPTNSQVFADAAWFVVNTWLVVP
jgi:hypothetical protein